VCVLQVSQPRAVGQVLEVDGLGCGLVGTHPPQQVRPGLGRLAPQRVGEEAPVGAQQHPGLQMVQQRHRQRRFGFAVPPDLGGEDRMGAALGQRHHTSLGEPSPLTLVDPAPPEVLVVRGSVGDIQTHPINGDQPTSSQPHPGRVIAPDRRSHPGKQRRQRLRTQPHTSLEDRGLARRLVLLGPARGPRQPIGQLRKHILHTTLASTGPSRSRSTPSPAPTTPDDAAQSGRPQQSPRQPTPARTPASAHPPRQGPTNDAQTPASSTQLLAYHQLHPHTT
jgi:hypothetical protein